ncbi:hypothetical protein FHS21_003104 [Phyllobacterium trifolii]|uniref:Uncharacterized protein n=1 Tax=Phyllobacterium trifolii TaxID=300193 RepID=A0A839U7G8_9HYPH|nr:hypothetical protein [Phyllobacterium trifolii]
MDRTKGSGASSLVCAGRKSIPYERVKFDAPDLGKRKKRPDDYIAPEATAAVVPDVA